MTEANPPKQFDPDIEGGLEKHKARWAGCTACNLGTTLLTRIEETEPQRKPPCQVFGDGVLRSIFVIGPPPTWREERDQRFLARGKYIRETNTFEPSGGDMVRRLFQELKFHEVYYTGTTLCRACHIPEELPGAQEGVAWHRDRPALDPEIKACRTRLHEEIYIVDPLLILALGQTVAKALTGRIITSYGGLQQLAIPARTQRAHITSRGWPVKDKRDPRGFRCPSEPWEIEYPLMVLRDPDDVLRNRHNKDPRGEMPQFIEHVKLAVRMVREYRNEVQLKESPIYVDAEHPRP